MRRSKRRKLYNTNNAQNSVSKNDINLGDIKVKFLAQDVVNKTAGEDWDITGVSQKDMVELNAIFDRSEIALKRRWVAEQLFYKGYVLGVNYIVDGKQYVDFFNLLNYEKVADEVISAVCVGGSLYEVNGNKFDQYIIYQYDEDGKPIVQYGYYKKNDPSKNFVVFEELTYEFKLDVQPITLIPNLQSYKGDIEHLGLRSILEEINRQSNWNGPEFDIIKNNVLINNLANSEKDEAEWSKAFHNGNVHMVNDQNGNVLAIAAPLQSDKNTLTIMQINIDWLMDKVDKYIFALRDTTSTGTNKFNSEIMMYNQLALEMLINKKQLRDIYFTKFVKKILMFSNSLGNTNVNIDKVSVQTKMSAVEQIKLDTMKNQAENLQTKNITNKQTDNNNSGGDDNAGK